MQAGAVESLLRKTISVLVRRNPFESGTQSDGNMIGQPDFGA